MRRSLACTIVICCVMIFVVFNSLWLSLVLLPVAQNSREGLCQVANCTTDWDCNDYSWSPDNKRSVLTTTAEAADNVTTTEPPYYCTPYLNMTAILVYDNVTYQREVYYDFAARCEEVNLSVPWNCWFRIDDLPQSIHLKNPESLSISIAFAIVMSMICCCTILISYGKYREARVTDYTRIQ